MAWLAPELASAGPGHITGVGDRARYGLAVLPLHCAACGLLVGMCVCAVVKIDCENDQKTWKTGCEYCTKVTCPWRLLRMLTCPACPVPAVAAMGSRAKAMCFFLVLRPPIRAHFRRSRRLHHPPTAYSALYLAFLPCCLLLCQLALQLPRAIPFVHAETLHQGVLPPFHPYPLHHASPPPCQAMIFHAAFVQMRLLCRQKAPPLPQPMPPSLAQARH